MNKTKVKTYASDRVKCILDNSHVASGLTKDARHHHLGKRYDRIG